MRFFYSILICGFFSVAMATGHELPFSESAGMLLDVRSLSATDLERLDAFVARMDNKKESFRKIKNFLYYLNDQAHREVLLNYEQLSSFEELVSEGKYNCLTGSTFFALLLERYQIPYKVIETNYHMFILIEEEGKHYLLDATDPIDGFETNSSVIENRLAQFRSNNQEVINNTMSFQFDLFNQVKISQLKGLLAFNNSVAAYNQQSFAEAVDYLYEASLFYNSPRIIEMATLIESYLLPDQKESLQKIAKIRRKENVLLARN